MDGAISNELFDEFRDEPRLSEHGGTPLRAPLPWLTIQRSAASARGSASPWQTGRVRHEWGSRRVGQRVPHVLDCRSQIRDTGARVTYRTRWIAAESKKGVPPTSVLLRSCEHWLDRASTFPTLGTGRRSACAFTPSLRPHRRSRARRGRTRRGAPRDAPCSRARRRARTPPGSAALLG